MGFDIYGLAPKTKGKKPEIDWSKATDKDKDAYFKAMDKFEEENPGYYFRNNVWWWRPLGELIHDKCGDLLSDAVSYTHLTLPPIVRVCVSGVGG